MSSWKASIHKEGKSDWKKGEVISKRKREKRSDLGNLGILNLVHIDFTLFSYFFFPFRTVTIAFCSKYRLSRVCVLSFVDFHPREQHMGMKGREIIGGKLSWPNSVGHLSFPSAM